MTALLSPQEKETLGYFVRGYLTAKASHATVMNDEKTGDHRANILLKVIHNERTCSILRG